MNFIKAIIAILVLYVGFLYYSRPELEITPDSFINSAKSSSLDFNINRNYMKNTKIAYSAINKKKSLRIDYIIFDSNESAHLYYEDFINSSIEKHQQNIKRDVRINGKTAEKQSYVDAYTYKIAIYAQDTVIFAKVDSDYKPEIDNLFNELFKPVKFDFSNPESYILKFKD